jgi:AcrR family transcriptional regulator
LRGDSVTRQRIIEGAAGEIRTRGVALTRLDDVMARTRTSKSQLFHYFPDGKERSHLVGRLATGDLSYLEAAIDEGIATLRNTCKPA